MPHALLPRIQNNKIPDGGEGEGGGESSPTPQRFKITGKASEDIEKKSSIKRLKDVEICVPVAYGTMSFWLGKKATETRSHKWTVYVRGATNEDLGIVIKHVVFRLHPSFSNPVRVVESPPIELSECGWGEFEIAISLFFHSDACDKQLDLYHHLKLYSEDGTGPLSTKKPVVVESYDEIVFPDPSENFFACVQNHLAVLPWVPATLNLPLVQDVHKKTREESKYHPFSQWFTNFSEGDELLKLSAARQQVQGHIVKLRRRLSTMDWHLQELQSSGS